MLPRFVGSGRRTFLGLTFATLMTAGCSGDGPTTVPPPPPPPLAIAPNSVVLAVGGGMQLVVSPNGRASEVVWSTSDPAVAEVSSTGFVTAHRLGSAQITGRAGPDIATARIVVNAVRCLLRCTFDGR